MNENNTEHLALELATKEEIAEFERNLEKYSPLAKAKKNYKGRIITLEEYAEEERSKRPKR